MVALQVIAHVIWIGSFLLIGVLIKIDYNPRIF